MLFGVKKIVFYISAESISVYEIELEKTSRSSLREVWKHGTQPLPDFLAVVRKKFGKNIRLLIDDSNAYVLALTGLEKPNAENVIDAVSGIIPEDIRSSEWKYYKQGEYIQLIAYHKELIDNLINPIRKAGFEIEFIGPISTILGRQIEKPSIIVYKNSDINFIAVKSEVVIASVKDQIKNLREGLANFRKYIREKYQFESPAVICVGITVDECKTAEDKDVEYTSSNLDPYILIAATQTIVASSESSVSSRSSSKTILVSVVAILSIVAGGGWLALNRFQFTAGEERKPTPAVVIRLTPVYTPTSVPVINKQAQVNKNEYSIRVLNGSGRSGEASKLSQSLTENGYNVVETGNSEGRNIGNTKIQFYTNVPEDIQVELDKFLQETYTKVTAENKIASDGADITIIIGG